MLQYQVSHWCIWGCRLWSKPVKHTDSHSRQGTSWNILSPPGNQIKANCILKATTELPFSDMRHDTARSRWALVRLQFTINREIKTVITEKRRVRTQVRELVLGWLSHPQPSKAFLFGSKSDEKSFILNVLWEIKSYIYFFFKLINVAGG